MPVPTAIVKSANESPLSAAALVSEAITNLEEAELPDEEF
jgi:hypothetical protein